MRRLKSPKHIHKLNGASFNLDHAAALSLADYQAAHAHLWPDMSEADRNAALASVHEKAMEKTAPKTAKTSDNGNASADASKLPVAKPGAVNSRRGGAGSNDGGKS